MAIFYIFHNVQSELHVREAVKIAQNRQK